MSATNPADIPPGEVWSVDTPAGKLGEWIGVRNDPETVEPWRLCRTNGIGFGYASDPAVVLRHRMVEQRPITRADLPGVHSPGIHGDAERAGADMMLDAVVERLNTAGPDWAGVDWKARHNGMKRERDEAVARAERAERSDNAADALIRGAQSEMMRHKDRADVLERELGELRESWGRIRRDADRWFRAHGIVEGERDQARDERDQYRRSGDEWIECHADAVRERDEWKARAEAAERELAALRERIEDIIPGTEVIHDAWNGHGVGRLKVTRELGVQCLIRNRVFDLLGTMDIPDPTPGLDATLGLTAPAVARAEAAEARTAPTVTDTHIDSFDVPPPPVATQAADDNPLDDFPEDAPTPISAVSVEDIVEVIRGRNLTTPRQVADAVMSLLSGDDPAVFVVRESDLPEAVEVDGVWHVGDSTYARATPESLRNDSARYLTLIAKREAVARAIEAAQSDPVEDAAVAAFKAAWHRADEEGDEGNRVRRGIRAARHVLGEEAKR